MEFNRSTRWVIIVFAIVALVGFIDSAYLTAEHFRGTIPPCSVIQGCERVLTSSYAVIGGIPVALIGVSYYLALLILLVTYWDTQNPRTLRIAAWLTLIGFGGTLYFIYIQAFVLYAFCQYCLLSAVTSTTLLVLSGASRFFRSN